jgi:hypothetical protein
LTRLALALSVVALLMCGVITSEANAHSSAYNSAKVRYYRANGIVHWIGNHARVTQYHPNAKRRAHWQKAVKFWIGVRRNAWLVMHPKPKYVVPGFPPHHSLWVCISRYEGSPTSINPNGHYGMLQMHAGWGYGTSYHASDDPQSVQEWAAENGWHANGYPSTSFLYGQWFNWDGAAGECLKYAW